MNNVHPTMERRMLKFAPSISVVELLLICELYDSAALDARAETLPLNDFEPMIHRVLSVPLRSIYKC